MQKIDMQCIAIIGMLIPPRKQKHIFFRYRFLFLSVYVGYVMVCLVYIICSTLVVIYKNSWCWLRQPREIWFLGNLYGSFYFYFILILYYLFHWSVLMKTLDIYWDNTKWNLVLEGALALLLFWLNFDTTKNLWQV